MVCTRISLLLTPQSRISSAESPFGKKVRGRARAILGVSATSPDYTDRPLLLAAATSDLGGDC